MAQSGTDDLLQVIVTQMGTLKTGISLIENASIQALRKSTSSEKHVSDVESRIKALEEKMKMYEERLANCKCCQDKKEIVIAYKTS